MNYLIIPPNNPPFLTKWFIPENNFIQGMIVFDLYTKTYYDGDGEWKDIPEDHL